MYILHGNNHEELGQYRSVTKAVSAAEEYFQCGTLQELKEVKKSLRLLGNATINHRAFNEVTCEIINPRVYNEITCEIFSK